MSAKRNYSNYIGATLCKGVRRGRGFKVKAVNWSGLFDFVMAHYADDVERMRRNEWRNDEEDI